MPSFQRATALSPGANSATTIPLSLPGPTAQSQTMQEKDHSIKTVQSKGAAIDHSSGGKIPYVHGSGSVSYIYARLIPRTRYPKHVWSPAGGWYAQPANWRANTAVMAAVILGITAMAWSISADREQRSRFPEERRFFPSRWYEDYCHTLPLAADWFCLGGVNKLSSMSERRKASNSIGHRRFLDILSALRLGS